MAYTLVAPGDIPTAEPTGPLALVPPKQPASTETDHQTVQGASSPGEHADLVAALAAAWERHGREAITRMIDEEPAKFVQVVASVVGARAESERER